MISEEQDFSDADAMRLKAEQILRDTQKDKAKQLIIETDLKKLLHQLQVHQIELEMQNEELIKANKRTEDALRRYTMLYDLAPMGYLTLDQNGAILELNFTTAELLGERRTRLLNSNFRFFVSDKSKVEFNDFLARVFQNNSKETCKVVLGDDDQHFRQVYIEGIVTGEEQQCLLSMMDIAGFWAR